MLCLILAHYHHEIVLNIEMIDMVVCIYAATSFESIFVLFRIRPIVAAIYVLVEFIFWYR